MEFDVHTLEGVLGLAALAVLLYVTNLGAGAPVQTSNVAAAPAESGPSEQERRAEMLKQAQIRKAQKDAAGGTSGPPGT